jgi:hypothetical protein
MSKLFLPDRKELTLGVDGSQDPACEDAIRFRKFRGIAAFDPGTCFSSSEVVTDREGGCFRHWTIRPIAGDLFILGTWARTREGTLSIWKEKVLKRMEQVIFFVHAAECLFGDQLTMYA